MQVRLQRFNYRIDYVIEKKERSENNDGSQMAADGSRWQPKNPMAAPSRRPPLTSSKPAKGARRWSSSEWPLEPASEAPPSTTEDGFTGSRRAEVATIVIGASYSVPADAVSTARLQTPEALAQEGDQGGARGIKKAQRHI